MVLADTSALVDAITGPQRSLPVLRRLLGDGERVVLSTLVLYEWWRGPRLPQELEMQEALFPADTAIPFGPQEARVAASLYAQIDRPRRREVDLAIAACAIVWGAALWTTNPRDFRDVPRLEIYGNHDRPLTEGQRPG